MNETYRPKTRELIFILAITIVISFTLFSPTLKGGYVLDDHSVVEMRTELRHISHIREIFFLPWHPEAPWAGNWRPLVLFSYAFNFLFSEKTAGLHFVNIVFHALNVFLIFLIVVSFSSRRNGYIVAALFMFLPIHAEAVVSIVGRSDVMGATFMLLALLLYLRKSYIYSSAVFLLALLAKDFSIAFLPLIGVLLLIETKNIRQSFKIGLIYAAPLPLYFWGRYLALGQYALGGYGFIDRVIGPLAFVPLKERVLTGFAHFFLYIRKSFLPFDLSPDYSYNQIPAVSNIFHSFSALAGLFIFIGLMGLIYYGRKEIKIASALLLIPFAVMSNIFFITTGTFADRWWYFPSFGMLLLAVLGVDKLRVLNYNKLRPSNLALLFGPVILIIVWYGVIIYRIDRAWLDDRTLYTFSAERSPNSVGARTNIAAVYLKEQQFNLARREIDAAMKIYDKNPATLSILGKLNWRDKDYAGAEAVFKKAVANDPRRRNSRHFYRLLTFLMLDLGRNKEAIGYMEQAIKEPVVGAKENVIKTDQFFYELLIKYKDNSIASYTKSDRETLIILIKLVRGF